MGAGLLLLTAGAYVWVAAEYLRDGRVGMALAFAAYALANLGFMLDLRKP